jgi:hypothetical protein
MTVVRLDANGIAVRAVIDPIKPISLGQTFDIAVDEGDVIGWSQ